MYSLIATKNNSSNIWNGGNFGFEGSILSIILQLIAIGIVFIIFKNRLKGDNYFGPKDNPVTNERFDVVGQNAFGFKAPNL